MGSQESDGGKVQIRDLGSRESSEVAFASGDATALVVRVGEILARRGQ